MFFLLSHFEGSFKNIIIILKANHTVHIIQHTWIIVMASATRYCIRDTTTNLYTDDYGNILTKGDVIFCKKQPFIITKDGYIDHYTTVVIHNIFQAPDSEFEVLHEKVKSQKSERNGSFIGKMLLSLTGIIEQVRDRLHPRKH